MSRFYNPKRDKNLFDPKSEKPYPISRTKIELFVDCPKCFYFDVKLGTGRVPGYPFSLNSAVDKLLKKEFDIHRAKGNPHPLMKKYKIDAIPFQHEQINEWRNNKIGIRFLHKPTNLMIFGAIDDVWINPKKILHIVDYKSTSKDEEVNLDADWQEGYKRQMEIYQWLFRQNGFKVSDLGYFVYCNGRTDKKAFDGKLEFDITVLPHKGNDGWVEKTIIDAHKCLMSDKIPAMAENCDFCRYGEAIKEIEKPQYFKMTGIEEKIAAIKKASKKLR